MVPPDSSESPSPQTGRTRRRIYGVDFSGAQDAGANVWLASVTRRDGRLVVEGAFPGAALPDSGRDREACLPALQRFLAGAGDAVVGIDVPFGLPAELVDADTWRAFVGAFPDGAADPESWAAACRERAEALDRERVELKRATDEAVGATFSPYNLRMRAATFYGLRDVLGPLVAAGDASVLPMQPPESGGPWLVEAYPAGTLDRLGVEREGYKDDEDRRREIADALADLDVVLAPAVRDVAVGETDALDAVLAAVGVARAMDDGAPLSPGTVETRTRLEGRIYC